MPSSKTMPSSRSLTTVACAANGQIRKCVDVKPVEKDAGVGTMQLDLAQGRDVAEPHAGANGLHFTTDALQPGPFTGPGEILRAQPRSCFHEDRVLQPSPIRVTVSAGSAETSCRDDVQQAQRFTIERMRRAITCRARCGNRRSVSAAMMASPLTLDVLP